MVKVTIKSYGKDPVDIIKDITSAWFQLQAETLDVGQDLEKRIRDFISSNKKTQTPEQGGHSLEENIQFTELYGPAHCGIGIGDIDYLDMYSPYWKVINYGSGGWFPGAGKRVPIGSFNTVPGAPFSIASSEGILAPGGNSKGRWITGMTDEYGKYRSFMAKRPIMPMNYIEYLDMIGRDEVIKLFDKYNSNVNSKLANGKVSKTILDTK